MGRAPCCDKANVKRGPWSPEEDAKLKDYIEKHSNGGNWIALPQKAGLRRCGKSCRLRWLNYLRPNIRHGEFSDDEDRIICSLFSSIGSRWSIIAAQLPGRTDNDIKNYWNTKLKKKLLIGMTPSNQIQRRPHFFHALPSTNNNNNNNNNNDINNHPLLQNYSIPSPYSTVSQISAPYESGNSNYYSTMPFSTLTSPSLLQAQDGCLGPTQVSYNQVKQSNKGDFLKFGTEAASRSSSDGSQGRDQVEQVYGENLGLQSYFSNSGGDLIGYDGDEKAVANGCYSENALDFSIEEIKQLISSNNVSSDFFVDEIKTEEKEIYY